MEYIVDVYADCRWLDDIEADSPHSAYLQSVEKMISAISEPNTDIIQYFWERCDIEDETFYPDNDDSYFPNHAEYAVSILLTIRFVAKVEANNLQEAQEKAFSVFDKTKYPDSLCVGDCRLEEF